MTADRLYGLLPYVYRMRDAERGAPLRTFLGVVERQVDVLERDLDRLYDNWFIETCDQAMVPYLGDLIGWLSARDEGYAHAFENRQTIRAALDRVHVKPDARLAGAREIAFFPPMTGG